jgi:hypothetical protein
VDRQRPEQQLIEERKNGCVRADPERQRKDGDRGNERRLEQRPEREFEIVGHEEASASP